MATVKLITFFCAISCAIAASAVDVCLVNKNALNRETLRYVEASLKTQEKDLDAVLRFTCESDSQDAVIIFLRGSPAANQHPNALGAALVVDGKVLRQVEVFCEPVRRLVRMRYPLLPALEGWALAKVAAHEMHHYLYNDHKHSRLNEKFVNTEGLLQGFRNLSLTASPLD